MLQGGYDLNDANDLRCGMGAAMSSADAGSITPTPRTGCTLQAAHRSPGGEGLRPGDGGGAGKIYLGALSSMLDLGRAAAWTTFPSRSWTGPHPVLHPRRRKVRGGPPDDRDP